MRANYYWHCVQLGLKKNKLKHIFMISIYSKLLNGECLVVSFTRLVTLIEYSAKVEDTEDDRLIDFEGSSGVLSSDQTEEGLLIELTAYCDSILSN